MLPVLYDLKMMKDPVYHWDEFRSNKSFNLGANLSDPKSLGEGWGLLESYQERERENCLAS